MDKLWAPWRKEYITRKKPKGCIFCNAYRQRPSVKTLVLQKTKHSFSMLNLFPYNNGHILVSPVKHIIDLNKLNQAEMIDLMNLVRLNVRLLGKVLKPQGYNIGFNQGEISGAGIADHLHIHIVPRWKGDSNFMPVIAQTKIISESLTSLYGSLKKCLQENK